MFLAACLGVILELVRYRCPVRGIMSAQREHADMEIGRKGVIALAVLVSTAGASIPADQDQNPIAGSLTVGERNAAFARKLP